MFKPDRRLTRWYTEYNKQFFENKLPVGILVGWDIDEPDAARLHAVIFNKEEDGVDMTTGTIRLDPNKHKGATDARFSLLHEMCHLRLAPWNKHGKRFNNEMRRLAVEGAFDDLW
jgi:hypothetical protein